MRETMKASELYAPRSSRIISKLVPVVSKTDILIKVAACGVCGSEYHNWQGGSDSYPLYFGHEAAGEVVEVGENVSCFKKGDRVTGLFEWAFAEYAVVDQNRVVLIPDSVQFEEALGEPISCIVSGCRRIKVDLGSTVALVGVGFMGLLTLQLMKAKGATRLIAVDPRKDMLETARSFGADEAYLPEELPENYKLFEMNGTTGVDIVIESTGKEKALNLAIEMQKNHGILSVVGFHQGASSNINLEMLNWKSGMLINAHERRRPVQMQCMEIGMKLLESGQLNLKPMITNRYPLEAVDNAFEDFETKKTGFIKSVILL